MNPIKSYPWQVWPPHIVVMGPPLLLVVVALLLLLLDEDADDAAAPVMPSVSPLHPGIIHAVETTAPSPNTKPIDLVLIDITSRKS